MGTGSGAAAPEVPNREGYTFSGWDVSFENITGNLTVTVQYTLIPTVQAPVAVSVPETSSNGSYSVSWGSSGSSDVTYVLEEATNAGFSSGLRQVYKGNETSANIVGRTIGVT